MNDYLAQLVNKACSSLEPNKYNYACVFVLLDKLHH